MSSRTSHRRPFWLFLGLFGTIAAVVSALWFGQTPDAGIEITRDQLELREDGVLVVKATGQPFNGLLVEYFTDNVRHSAVEINDGRAHGVTRGWYPTGQLEVEEHFVTGVSHGLRTRWYENGSKKSQANIVAGELAGTFIQWHENGNKAVEMNLVAGKPEGITVAWHTSGALKSEVTMKSGAVLEQQFFADSPALDLEHGHP